MINQKIHQKTVYRMKVVLLFCIIFFFKNTIYCQSLESIKTADTIYIYFDKESKDVIKYSNANKHIEFYKNQIIYEFNPSSLNTIFLISNTYKNSDDVEKGIKNDERIEKKSFLKKNKNIILDIDFFTKYGFKETFFALFKKIIYIIDKDDMKGRKIKVKQVDIACFTCFKE
jgi:hypothetical protein